MTEREWKPDDGWPLPSVCCLGGCVNAPDAARNDGYDETPAERDQRRKERADRARLNVSMSPGQAKTLSAASRHDEGVRPWVKRLASYLRIFGNARTDAPGKEYAYYIDSLTHMAKEREDEHGLS